jgi:pyridoxal phosphate enzyme (YggS family)
MSIANNVAHVRDRLIVAGHRAGRNPNDITLMAVSKTFPPEAIREGYAAGLRVFGENRVQEFVGKIEPLRDLTDAAWHLIGHLQSNKANKAVELFSAIDSVDSLKLAHKLNSAARSFGKKLDVLIEINIGGEKAKSGVTPSSEGLEELLLVGPQLESLTIRGLMTVPPYFDDPEQARPHFRQLRQLRDTIAGRRLPSIDMSVLSMGMSHDFEVAIEEGSTCVRVGTAIFGSRSYPKGGDAGPTAT